MRNRNLILLTAEHQIPAGAWKISSLQRHPQRLLRRDGHDLRARGSPLLGGGRLRERADGGRVDDALRAHRKGHDARPQVPTRPTPRSAVVVVLLFMRPESKIREEQVAAQELPKKSTTPTGSHCHTEFAEECSTHFIKPFSGSSNIKRAS